MCKIPDFRANRYGSENFERDSTLGPARLKRMRFRHAASPRSAGSDGSFDAKISVFRRTGYRLCAGVQIPLSLCHPAEPATAKARGLGQLDRAVRIAFRVVTLRIIL